MFKNFYFKLTFIILVCWGLFSKAQYISVDNRYTADELVQKFIGAQNLGCVSFSNAAILGGGLRAPDSSYGYFDRGTSSFDINEGIILSTGSVLKAPGPKTGIQSVTAANWIGDVDLSDATGISMSELSNATVLEFDFTSLQSTKISFRYMFLSEEYRPDNCAYSDAFAFLIKKADNSGPYKNIAVVPGTNIAVTSTTITGADKYPCTPTNAEYFGGFVGLNDSQNSPTNFNGQTKILTASTDVVPGVQYHIKLVIADEGRGANSQYDSAVFLEAGSFLGNKDLGQDRLIRDRNALCANSTLVLDATTLGASYQWYKDNVLLPGETNATYTVTSAGTYSVLVTNSGCDLKGEIQIEYYNAPVLKDLPPFIDCDSDFDGNIPVDFNRITSLISDNLEGYQLDFYSDPAYVNKLPANWAYHTDTTVYVKASSVLGCPDVTSIIDFKVGTSLTLNQSTYTAPPECDDDLDGIKSVDLSEYLTQYTTDSDVNVSYYDNLQNAENKQNPVSNPVPVDQNGTYYLRFSKTDFCDVIANLTLTINTPEESAILKDQSICPGTTTTLTTENTFIYYKWTDENGITIKEGPSANFIDNVEIGNYFVYLTSPNGCVYKQSVSVTAIESPIISQINITGNTVEIIAQNGTKPYEYSIDGQNFQSSNIFNNVPRGVHTAYVKSSNGCDFSTKDFIIINLINVITPNGDGKNDALDYSDLKIKNDVSLEIFDRNGKLIFKSADKNYTWDGKSNGRNLPTGNYWYVLKWVEPDTQIPVVYTNWILLRNR